MSAYCRFCATKWLYIGIRVRLTEVSAECRFIVQKMWKENFGTQAGVHLIEGVRLTWGPLNTGSTVFSQEPITRSVQLPYIGGTAFSQVELFLDTPFPRKLR